MTLYKIYERILTSPHWFIAYRKKTSFSIPFDTSGFQIIQSPPGRFYADPFIIKYDKRNLIFFEEYCFTKQKGVISFLEIDSQGNYSSPQIVLETNYHLSYPFLFSWNKKIYMIPETAENRTIELYCAKNFPYDWTLEKVLMNHVKAHDTTLWFAGEKIWMFTNIDREEKKPYSELCLFYAKSLFDEWTAHPNNPVVSDIVGARPAGNLFLHNGDLIRPGQNSLIRYGHALTLNKLLCLTENDYKESKIEEIHPRWYPNNKCCHTYNFNEDFEVMDGAFIKNDFMKPYRRLKSLFR